MRLTTEDRFWSHVRRGRGCWEWQAYCAHGYGYITHPVRPGGPRRAHRVAWELANGPIPDGLCVLHRCDNPECVRVEHLFLGTQRDNMLDRRAKGRWKGGAPRSLEAGRVVAARAIFAAGAATIGQLAQELGASHGVASNAVRGVTYRDLPGAVPL